MLIWDHPFNTVGLRYHLLREGVPFVVLRWLFGEFEDVGQFRFLPEGDAGFGGDSASNDKRDLAPCAHLIEYNGGIEFECCDKLICSPESHLPHIWVNIKKSPIPRFPTGISIGSAPESSTVLIHICAVFKTPE